VTFKRIQFRKKVHSVEKKKENPFYMICVPSYPCILKFLSVRVSKIHEKIHPKNSENNFASIANNKKKRNLIETKTNNCILSRKFPSLLFPLFSVFFFLFNSCAFILLLPRYFPFTNKYVAYTFFVCTSLSQQFKVHLLGPKLN